MPTGAAPVPMRLYLAHSPCEAVILIDPYCVDIRTDLRMAQGWTSERLTRLDEWLTIPACGLHRPVPCTTGRPWTAAIRSRGACCPDLAWERGSVLSRRCRR
jgi:hypothetical protein